MRRVRKCLQVNYYTVLASTTATNLLTLESGWMATVACMALGVNGVHFVHRGGILNLIGWDNWEMTLLFVGNRLNGMGSKHVHKI